MNRQEQIADLAAFYRLLGTVAQYSPPRAQEFLKLQRQRIAAQINVLGGKFGGEPAMDNIPEGTEDETPGMMADLVLRDLPTDDVTPVEISTPAEILPTLGPDSPVTRCLHRSLAASSTLAWRNNHWWQNWGKHLGYICQRMFFPLSVDEIAAAIQVAERDGMPLRAFGGGWSFSDVAIPGEVTGSLPNALGVEAWAKIVPLAETFSTDPSLPAIAEIASPEGSPADGPGSLVLFDPATKRPHSSITYLGGGRWSVSAEEIRNLFRSGYRPIQPTGPDDAGSLVLFDYRTGSFYPFAFYGGNGKWLNVYGEPPRIETLSDIARTPRSYRPRASNAAWSMSLLATPQPVYLINTESLASSLQQNLPNLLSEAAQREMNPGTPGEPNLGRKYYFHVEAGIKMSDLSKLLGHQSPRLAIEASGGSPGATLAGVLATATHGGEHKTPLLVDRVKAVHLVSPGGVQWWIEGDTSIADPAKLMECYPCLTRNHIITGTDPVGGIRPQDWLNAVVVSMGCMGVVYSVVLEVVPIYGIHEVVAESTWNSVLRTVTFDFGPPRNFQQVRVDDLRRPLPELTQEQLGRVLADQFASGMLTGISRSNNRYVDIAIDPNPIISEIDGTRDWNCWIINREVTRAVPFEPKPSPRDLIGRIGKSIEKRFSPRDPLDPREVLAAHEVLERLTQLQEVNSIRRIFMGEWDFGDIGAAIAEAILAISKFEWLAESADTIDTILDLLTAPFEASSDPAYASRDFKTASAIVSGLFSGLLGVVDGRGELTGIVSRVGEIGFPASGIMGTAIEISMAPSDAFVFLQNEVLDRITKPFFGYVSVRFCPQTQALLGMQQYSPSIMIEIVAFRTPSAFRFVAELHERTVDRIRQGGLDAMLHWGLECQALDAAALRAIPAINTGSPTKLEKFTTVKSLIRAAAPAGENVFDNRFTRRLAL